MGAGLFYGGSAMVHVAPAGITSDEALAAWVERGISFAKSLPSK